MNWPEFAAAFGLPAILALIGWAMAWQTHLRNRRSLSAETAMKAKAEQAAKEAKAKDRSETKQSVLFEMVLRTNETLASALSKSVDGRPAQPLAAMPLFDDPSVRAGLSERAYSAGAPVIGAGSLVTGVSIFDPPAANFTIPPGLKAR